jgi:hypothetical protein
MNPSIVHLKNSNFKGNEIQSTARRSKNAVNKVAKMKKVYQQQNFVRSETLTSEKQSDRDTNNITGHNMGLEKINTALNDDFDNQVNDLYLWSQNLSLNDDYLKPAYIHNV